MNITNSNIEFHGHSIEYHEEEANINNKNHILMKLFCKICNKKFVCIIEKSSSFINEQRKYFIERSRSKHASFLSLEQRIKLATINDDFNCPFCIKKTKITIRKQAISGSILKSGTIVNINYCHECKNEFDNEFIFNKRADIKFTNKLIKERIEKEAK